MIERAHSEVEGHTMILCLAVTMNEDNPNFLAQAALIVH